MQRVPGRMGAGPATEVPVQLVPGERCQGDSGNMCIEGSGALVYVRAGAGRCQGCEPDPRSWLSHRFWPEQGQGVGVRD